VIRRGSARCRCAAGEHPGPDAARATRCRRAVEELRRIGPEPSVLDARGPDEPAPCSASSAAGSAALEEAMLAWKWARGRRTACGRGTGTRTHRSRGFDVLVEDGTVPEGARALLVSAVHMRRWRASRSGRASNRTRGLMVAPGPDPARDGNRKETAMLTREQEHCPDARRFRRSWPRRSRAASVSRRLRREGRLRLDDSRDRAS
jgi:hypothetical protein